MDKALADLLGLIAEDIHDAEGMCLTEKLPGSTEDHDYFIRPSTLAQQARDLFAWSAQQGKVGPFTEGKLNVALLNLMLSENAYALCVALWALLAGPGAERRD
tara:strand:+ start:2030 stop:2338 length:309 start_codon:yes stop_codon:yes gene_type:complete